MDCGGRASLTGARRGAPTRHAVAELYGQSSLRIYDREESKSQTRAGKLGNYLCAPSRSRERAGNMVESADGGQLGSASDDDTQQVDESKNSTRHAVVDGTSDGAQPCDLCRWWQEARCKITLCKRLCITRNVLSEQFRSRAISFKWYIERNPLCHCFMILDLLCTSWNYGAINRLAFRIAATASLFSSRTTS